MSSTRIEYDITELVEMLDIYGDAQLLHYKPKEKANGQAAPFISSGPVDADARLAAMGHKGAGDSSIHLTQLHVTGSLTRAGCLIEDTVERVLARTKEVAPQPNSWDWEQERVDVMRMCTDLVNKDHNLACTLPDSLLRAWNRLLDTRRRPNISYNRWGAFVRATPERNNDADAPRVDDAPGIAPAALNEESKEKEEVVNERGRKRRFRLIPYEQMRVGMNEQPYLVHELIPAKGIVVIWGAPKCFKSFWTHDLCLHIAKGWEYHDRYVRQGAVVYCAFEGGHGYGKRIEAQRRHYKFDDQPPLFTMAGQANLIGEHAQLVRDIKEDLPDGIAPVAVVLDTLNRSLVGNENNPVDMTAYTRAAEVVREAFDCVVIIVHHCGWDATRPRGHSSLPAAVDAELSVTREGDVATVEVQYMRDGPEGTQVIVKSRVVPVGHDASGQELSSLVMVRYDGSFAREQAAEWPGSLRVLKAALLEAILSHGVSFKIENGPAVRAAELEKVREVFYRTNAVASESVVSDYRLRAQQQAFKRGVEKAQSLGLISAHIKGNSQMIWFTRAADAANAERDAA